MKFARHVQVHAPDGGFRFTVHGEEAQRMVTAGKAKRETRQVIRLTFTLSSVRPRPASPPRLSQYMGQQYTFRERLQNAAGEVDHSVVQFRRIDREDQALFMMAITDCGGTLREVPA